MEIFVATYCCACAQLQWNRRIGKACEFCGGTTFANVRPGPTFTAIDTSLLKEMNIAHDEFRKTKKTDK